MNISVIGTGYVGLATGVCLADMGHNVICVDKSIDIINSINNKISPTYEPYLSDMLVENINNKRFYATTDLDYAIKNSDISFICVGTPDIDGMQDLSQIKEASKQIGKSLKNKDTYHVIVIKSTVLPTTTDTLVKSVIEKYSKKSLGEFGLAMNPEFLRQGSAIKDFMFPGRIIIGYVDKESIPYLLDVYEKFTCSKIIMNSRSAEMVKYSCNSFLATMVSFSNEFAMICEKIENIDIVDVLKGLRSDYKFTINGEEPVANSYLWAGCGYGGSCFKKDVQAMNSFAKSIGVSTPILDGTMSINLNQPKHLVNIVKNKVDLKQNNICILGLSFKPDTDDMRESPSIPIIKELIKLKCNIKCHDPQAMKNAKNIFLKNIDITYCENKEEAMKNADIIFVVTPWNEYKDIDFKCKVLVDCRRIYNKQKIESNGIKYMGVGIC